MIIWVALICAALLLQSVLPVMLPFLEVNPDLVLLILIYAALSGGEKKGAFIGFLGGLAEDLVSGGILGVNALVKIIPGYLLGSSRKKFNYKSPGFQIISVFIISCFTQFSVFIVLYLSGQKVYLADLRNFLIPFAFLNAMISPFAFRLLTRGFAFYGKSKSG